MPVIPSSAHTSSGDFCAHNAFPSFFQTRNALSPSSHAFNFIHSRFALVSRFCVLAAIYDARFYAFKLTILFEDLTS